MITITGEPNKNGIGNPVGNCAKFCMTSDSVQTGDCLTNTSITLTYLEASGTPPDGTIFTLLNQSFAIDNAVTSTSNTFGWGASTTDAKNNILAMLQGNPLLFEYTFAAADITGGFTITITSCDCRPHSTISYDVSPLYMTGADNADGPGTIDEDFRYAVQLIEQDECKPLTGLILLNAIFFNGLLVESCFDINKYIALSVPRPPDPSSSKEASLEGAFVNVSVRYGERTVSSCIPSFGAFTESDTYPIVNAALTPFKDQGFAPYSYETDKPAKFLGTRPNYCHCPDELIHLSFYNNSKTRFDGGTLKAEFVLPDETIEEDIPNVDGIYSLPPVQNISARPLVVGESYTVRLIGNVLSDFDYTETITLYIVECCCEGEDNEVIFWDVTGGYSTLRLNCVKSREIEVNGVEICKEDQCGGLSEIDTGQRLLKSESRDRVSFYLTVENKSSWREYFRAFKISPAHYLRTKNESLDEVYTSFYLLPDGVKIFEKGDLLSIVVSGYKYVQKSFAHV